MLDLEFFVVMDFPLIDPMCRRLAQVLLLCLKLEKKTQGYMITITAHLALKTSRQPPTIFLVILCAKTSRSVYRWTCKSLEALNLLRIWYK